MVASVHARFHSIEYFADPPTLSASTMVCRKSVSDAAALCASGFFMRSAVEVRATLRNCSQHSRSHVCTVSLTKAANVASEAMLNDKAPVSQGDAALYIGTCRGIKSRFTYLPAIKTYMHKASSQHYCSDLDSAHSQRFPMSAPAHLRNCP